MRETEFSEPSQAQLFSINNSLKIFFSIYDKKFLKNNIKILGLFSNLRFEGKRVGGLSDGKDIYINVKSESNRDLFYLRALNHELSSNILDNMSYKNRVDWTISSGSYNYSRSYYEKCLEENTFYNEYDNQILENGFLTNYALTGMINDFNVYAERLFTNDPNLKIFAQRYPRIAKKLKILKQTYRQAGYTGKFPDET